MRMRTTTNEERWAAQARLESWARGEDAESLRALAEHLAAGQVSSMGQVDVEHYTTTLRTAVDIDIHTDPGVDPRGLAAWFRVRDSQVLWDGVWLSTANADDVDHITTIRLDAAWCVPGTDPIPAHPEHGPHLHIREGGTWGRCALCDNLYYMPYRDDRPMDMPRVMTQLQRAILPGVTTHPRWQTSTLNALDHDPAPSLRADDGTVNQLWFMHRAFRVAERNGWTPVEDWIEAAGWTAVFTRGGDTVEIGGGPHIRPRQQIELIRDALEDTP